MRNNTIYLILFIILGTNNLNAQNEFIFKWNLTGDLTVTIPTIGGGYNYDVDWGDGITTSNHMGDATHTYGATGIKTVEITGDFPRIYFNNSGDKEKIREISQWGNNPWTSFRNAFKGCTSLQIDATDYPNLSNVTDCRSMFEGITGYYFNLNGSIGGWNVSNVENAGSMFRSMTWMNTDISTWNVVGMTNMANMFNGASSFNQDIGSWNVTNVVQMAAMFKNTGSFNQNINGWDVQNVTNMTSMFHNSDNFNQNLNNWDVGNVLQMDSMFYYANDFNQDIGNWDVRKVVNMSYMLSNATSFNQDIGNWNVKNVTSMVNMLSNINLSQNNYDLLLIGWNSKNLKPNVVFGGPNVHYCIGENSRSNMINSDGWTITDDGEDCSKVFITTWKTTIPNEDIIIPTIGVGYDYTIDWGDGNVHTHRTGVYGHTYTNPGFHTITIRGDFPRININGGVQKDKIYAIDQWGDNPWTSMRNAFNGCSNLHILAVDEPILSDVTDCRSMFLDASSMNEDISSWNVYNVQNFGSMFRGASVYNKNIGSWNVSSATNMANMFRDALTFDQDLGNWNVSNVSNMINMFENVELSIVNYDALLEGWAALSLQSNVFFSAGNSTYCLGEDDKLDIETDFNWTITDGGEDCDASAFKLTYITQFNNQEVSLMTKAYSVYPNNVIDISIDWGDGTSSDFYSTSSSSSPSHIYAIPGTYNVSVIGNIPKLGVDCCYDDPLLVSIDQWGSSKWIDVASAFHRCVNLVSIPIEPIDLSHLDVKNIGSMFGYCTSFNDSNIQNWDVSEIEIFTRMFKGATSFNVDLNNWNMSSATGLKDMFGLASSFNGNISSWNLSNVTDMSYMFYFASSFNCNISSWNIDNTSNVSYMFNFATSFNQDLGSWDIFDTNATGFLKYAGLSTLNYDLTIQGWFAQNPSCCFTLDAGSFGASYPDIEYCESWYERKKLIDDYGWTFNDDGEASGCTYNLDIKNTNDDGKSSLRSAIVYANTKFSSTLTFNISGAGPYHINLISPLLDVGTNITIDGTTQVDVHIISDALLPAFNILNGKTFTIKDLILEITNDASNMVINNNGSLILDNIDIIDLRTVPKEIIMNNNGADVSINQVVQLIKN